MSSIWTIRRSATDSKLTGLCGGLSRYWGVDPVLIRLGAVLLALSGGLGLVLYLAGWLLVPQDGKNEPKIHDLLGEQAKRWPREVWIVLVAVACIAVFAIFGSLTPFGFGPAGILALIWYFGYYKNRRPGSNDPVTPPPPAALPTSTPPRFYSYPGPPTPFTQAADAWRQRVEEAQRVTPPTASYRGIYDVPTPYEDVQEPEGPADQLPAAAPLGAESAAFNAFLATPDPVGLYTENEPLPARTAPSTLTRAESRSARRLRLVSLVVLGLTLAGLGIADDQGVAIPPAAYFASALLVLGLTLVAAAWFGRARGLLPVALLALLATIGASVGGPVAHQQGWETRTVTYTTAPQLVPGDHQDRGQLKVDLTGLTSATNVSYTASMGLGNLEVATPKNMNVVVKWQVDNGGLILDGQKADFENRRGVVQPPRPDPKKKTLTLNLSVDSGVVQVRR